MSTPLSKEKIGFILGKGAAGSIVVVLALGFGAFFHLLFGEHPERAWQAYLINFLLWSSIAQGGLLFSVVMHLTKGRWSRPLLGLAESFSAFFPVSLLLFPILFLGRCDVFPWIGMELGGKGEWLNIQALFIRDLAGLVVLYTLGFCYLYYAMPLRWVRSVSQSRIRRYLDRIWAKERIDSARCRRRASVFAVLYALGYAVILSLIGYDLVMALDPHWYSTLFGAYHFVKAFYLALGALVILASLLHMNPDLPFAMAPSQFHDLGKLFFAFCLVWADFFYCQFVVIWYGNISEETAYIIERTMSDPWRPLAWFIFIVVFVVPFIVLLNRRVKSNPRWMSMLCALVILGLWLEHLLLVGPALNHHSRVLPIGFFDGLIFLGFFGIMAASVTFFLKVFPEAAISTPSGRDRC